MDHTTLRQKILSCLGNFPDRTALAPVFATASDEGTYTRTRVLYSVSTDEQVPAWLLIPKAEQPPQGWPALLAIHQHAGEFHLGKSEPAGLTGNPHMHYGKELCERGYVVLCPDLLCFEERRPPASHRLQGTDYERFAFTQLLLDGSCLQTKYLHDLSCALDLLTTLPEVNSQRLGVIGHSLGGQQALWLSWYDPRITATVSSCGFSLIRTLLRDGINHNFALYVPGMLRICDMDTLATMLAPRALLFTAGTTDHIFPIDGVQSIAETTQQAYYQHGTPERFQAAIFSGGHAFPEEIKAQAYSFLDQWLK